MNPKIRAKIRGVGKRGIYFVLITVCAFVVIEGVSSTVLLVLRIRSTSPLAERVHTRYDELLGWVNIPNLYIKNMYGPGVFFKTNSQGFRNNNDFSVNVSKGKVRVICSGDSFTLGYGVDNDHTWCEIMRSSNERFETVNMGQGGYGLDQIYLWYMRDGAKLEHKVHLLAIVSEDFKRLQDSSFLGYGKPVLELQNGRLEVRNVPVPKRAYYAPWLTGNLAAVRELDSVKLIGMMLSSKKSSSRGFGNDPLDTQRIVELGIKVCESLQQKNVEENSAFVVIYLPMRMDYYPNELDGLRGYLSAQLSSRRIRFLDLVDDLRKVPESQLDELFISGESGAYAGAAGHYSVKGNEYIARLLYLKLLAIPEISEVFKKQAGAEPGVNQRDRSAINTGPEVTALISGRHSM